MTMKITRIETIWIDEQPNTIWVRIHTDDGLIGLGETFYVPRAVSAMVHDVFANLLIGRSAFDIESHWQNMFYTVNFFGYGGSETRAISAVDVALWDLLGQYTGQPIYNLLGGRSRDRSGSTTPASATASIRTTSAGPKATAASWPPSCWRRASRP